MFVCVCVCVFAPLATRTKVAHGSVSCQFFTWKKWPRNRHIWLVRNDVMMFSEPRRHIKINEDISLHWTFGEYWWNFSRLSNIDIRRFSSFSESVSPYYKMGSIPNVSSYTRARDWRLYCDVTPFASKLLTFISQELLDIQGRATPNFEAYIIENKTKRILSFWGRVFFRVFFPTKLVGTATSPVM